MNALGPKHTHVSVDDFARWARTQPKGAVIVQGRPAEADNEIAYADAIDYASRMAEEAENDGQEDALSP